MKSTLIYESPELELLRFGEEDILTISGGGGDGTVTEKPGIELPRDEW